MSFVMQVFYHGRKPRQPNLLRQSSDVRRRVIRPPYELASRRSL